MQPSTSLPPELVIRSDNAALRRKFRLVLIMHIVLTVFSFAMIGVLTILDATLDIEVGRYFIWVFLILIAGEILQIGFQCYHWGGRLAISQPLTIDAWGLEFQGQRGTVRLPWEAVPEVRQKRMLGQPLLAFMIHPQAVPGQNGVEGDPEYWPTYVKKGLLLGNAGLVPGFEVILPAVQQYSQGRTRIS